MFDDTELQWIVQALLNLAENPVIRESPIAEMHIEAVTVKTVAELESRGWHMDSVTLYTVK